MKKYWLICAALLSAEIFAGVPITMNVETSRSDVQTIDVYHGETIEFTINFKSYGKPLALPTADEEVAYTFWQTSGMESAFWRIANVDQTEAADGRLKASFTEDMDVGNKTIFGFVGYPGQIYRAAFVLRFKNAPGFNPATIEWPDRTMDFDKFEVLNAPYYTKAEADEKFMNQYSPGENVIMKDGTISVDLSDENEQLKSTVEKLFKGMNLGVNEVLTKYVDKAGAGVTRGDMPKTLHTGVIVDIPVVEDSLIRWRQVTAPDIENWVLESGAVGTYDAAVWKGRAENEDVAVEAFVFAERNSEMVIGIAAKGFRQSAESSERPYKTWWTDGMGRTIASTDAMGYSWETGEPVGIIHWWSDRNAAFWMEWNKSTLDVLVSGSLAKGENSRGPSGLEKKVPSGSDEANIREFKIPAKALAGIEVLQGFKIRGPETGSAAWVRDAKLWMLVGSSYVGKALPVGEIEVGSEMTYECNVDIGYNGTDDIVVKFTSDVNTLTPCIGRMRLIRCDESEGFEVTLGNGTVRRDLKPCMLPIGWRIKNAASAGVGMMSKAWNIEKLNNNASMMEIIERVNLVIESMRGE